MKSISTPSGALHPPSDGDFDPNALARLRRFGGESLVRELVRLFADDAPQRLSDACGALARNDAAGVQSRLHLLKSSAAQLGAVSLQRLCQDGESLASRGALDDAAHLMDALARELARAQQWLRSASEAA
jgi:HPt (histidine-containing phosphotransfer) domain-containing protein